MAERVHTFCTLCNAHCAAIATVDKGKIVKWEQDKESGLAYLPCPSFKGGFINKEINEHPDRLKYPLKRVGARGEGKWQRISWDEALGTIAGKLNELKEKYGPECVATGVGEPRHMEFVWIQRLSSAFGTPNCTTPLAICGGQANAATSATYGPGHFFQGAEGPDKPKIYIVWGSGTPERTGQGRERIKASVRDGAKLVVIDPRRLSITRDADLWIKPRPTSDPVLAFGILKYIVDEGLYDKNFVENWTAGFDKLQEQLEKFTLDDVERITWVPRQQIEQVARWYGELKPGTIAIGMGAMRQQVQGFQGEQIVDILRGIVTAENLPFWRKKTAPSPTVRGGSLYLLDTFPRNLAKNLAKQHSYAVRSAYIPTQALCNGILEGKTKAAIFTQCDPLISYPNARKTYEAFSKLDLLVMLNIFMVPTAAISDIVLPVATAHECNTLICGTNGAFPRAVPKIVDPPGEARSDVMIINQLGKSLGLGEYFFDSDEDSINYLISPSGVDWEGLKKMRLLARKTEIMPEDTGYFTTPSGKLEVTSQRAIDMGGAAFPVWEEVQPTYDPTEDFPLVFTSREVDEYRLSAWRHVKYLRKRVPYPTVQIHPEVAEKAGAKDGDWVWIETKWGKIMQKLVIDPEVDPRVVMATFGWYFPEDPSNACQWDKANINILIPDEPVEPVSGATNVRGFPCRVFKAEESEVGLPPLDLTPGTTIVSKA